MTDDQTYPAAPEGSVRLNKFLASCGYESRRAADRLITEGRVEVNGKTVDTPGLRVLPSDFVKVDGHHATPKEEVVLLLNKPRGFVCSRDAQGADATVYDLLPPKYRHTNYVGRLDADSEGLLLFTNNGSLNQSIGHPSGGIEKEYWVTLDQAFDNSVLIQLLKGVRIPEGQAKAKYISRLSARRAVVVLEQGLKRQIRQMFSCLGLRVTKLVRVRIGSLWGGDLQPGNTAILTPEQVELACTNPHRRKGLMGAKQVFKPRPAPAPADAQEQELDESNYEFDPADFETEEEALESATAFSDGEGLEPEREGGKRPFGRVPFVKRERKPFRSGDRDFGGRKPFRSGDRDFGGRKPFRSGDRDFGGRKPFRSGDRDFGGRKPFRSDDRDFRERKPFRGGERDFGGRKPFRSDDRDFRERNPFRSDERDSRERKPFRGGDRDSRERKPFRGGDRDFGGRKPFRSGGSRDFGERPAFRSGEGRNFRERKPFRERHNEEGRKPFRSFSSRRPYNRGRED